VSDAQYTDSVEPDEVVPLTFAFANVTSAPLSPVLTIAWFEGAADARDLTTLLIGQPAIVGTDVRQIIGNLQADTTYEIRCLITTPEGFKYGLSALVPSEVR
jgi:hypothetical protein